jgi:hypothetical protein
MTIDQGNAAKRGDMVWVAQCIRDLVDRPSDLPVVFAGVIAAFRRAGGFTHSFEITVGIDRITINPDRVFLDESEAVNRASLDVAQLRRWCDAVEASLRSPVVPVGIV